MIATSWPAVAGLTLLVAVAQVQAAETLADLEFARGKLRLYNGAGKAVKEMPTTSVDKGGTIIKDYDSKKRAFLLAIDGGEFWVSKSEFKPLPKTDPRCQSKPATRQSSRTSGSDTVRAANLGLAEALCK